jgi:hypothetical protein
MPTYLNPHNAPIHISYTHEGKRSGGTLYPASWPKRPGALQAMEIPASKAAEYVRTGMLVMRDPLDHAAIPPAPPLTVPLPVASEPEELVVEVDTPDEDAPTPQEIAPVVQEDEPEEDEPAKRKAAKKAKFLADLARGRENARKLREAEAAVKAEALKAPPVEDHEDDTSCEEDDADDLDDTVELPAPVAPEEAEEVAKEETVRIPNPVSKKRRFVVRDED